MLKLFQVNYIDDCDDEYYLTVGESKEEVEEREISKLQVDCSCFIGAWVSEVNEIDGHKVIVE